LPDLLGPDFGVTRKVRDGYIEIKDQEIDPDPMHFNAVTSDGHILRNGDDFLTYLNPFKPNKLILTDPRDNKYIGEIPRQNIPSWADAEAVRKELGAARHELAERLKPLNTRHADRTRKRAEDTAHNTAIIASALAENPKARAAKVIARGNLKQERQEEQTRSEEAFTDFLTEIGSSVTLAPSTLNTPNPQP
jgi:hypothetical protein